LVLRSRGKDEPKSRFSGYGTIDGKAAGEDAEILFLIGICKKWVPGPRLSVVWRDRAGSA
jgi:hypothetical protein